MSENISTKQPVALLAWELGDNLGHITSLRQYALRLKAQGWRCVFVLKDTFRAHELLAVHGFEWLQAPVWMKLAAILQRQAIEKILNHLGLDPQPPPRAPARGQMALQKRQV